MRVKNKIVPAYIYENNENDTVSTIHTNTSDQESLSESGSFCERNKVVTVKGIKQSAENFVISVLDANVGKTKFEHCESDLCENVTPIKRKSSLRKTPTLKEQNKGRKLSFSDENGLKLSHIVYVTNCHYPKKDSQSFDNDFSSSCSSSSTTSDQSSIENDTYFEDDLSQSDQDEIVSLSSKDLVVQWKQTNPFTKIFRTMKRIFSSIIFRN